jgi:hypothetical protein
MGSESLFQGPGDDSAGSSRKHRTGSIMEKSYKRMEHLALGKVKANRAARRTSFGPRHAIVSSSFSFQRRTPPSPVSRLPEPDDSVPICICYCCFQQHLKVQRLEIFLPPFFSTANHLVTVAEGLSSVVAIVIVHSGYIDLHLFPSTESR